MSSGMVFQYHALEEPALLSGDFLSLRARKNGSFHGVDMGIYRGEACLATGYDIAVDEAELPPALAFGQDPAGWVLMHRMPEKSLEVAQEIHGVEGTPGMMLVLAFQSRAAVPQTLDIRLRLTTGEEQSQDVVLGTISAATSAGVLLWGAEETKAVLSEGDAPALTVRLPLGALGKGQVAFFLGLAPQKKEAVELLRYLRAHAQALEEHKRKRLALWRRMGRVDAPHPAFVEAWLEKSWRVERCLRLTPSGQRLLLEEEEQARVRPGKTPAYEALLAMGLFEVYAQGMLAVRDASLAFAPSGCVAGKVAADGQVMEIGDSLSTAQFVLLAYEGMCWTGDEGMLRTLFPFLKQNMDYLALISGAFGSQPGAVSLPAPVQQEVSGACRAYARLLKALRLPGDTEYQAHAKRVAPAKEEPGAACVEQVLAQHMPGLLDASMTGMYAAVPALMRELFGVRPRAHRREIVCAPALPMGWSQWTLRDVRIGQEMFSFRCVRGEGEANAKLTIYTGAKNWKAVLPEETKELNGENTFSVAL